MYPSVFYEITEKRVNGAARLQGDERRKEIHYSKGQTRLHCS